MSAHPLIFRGKKSLYKGRVSDDDDLKDYTYS